METVRKRSSGISSNGLRTWGMFFLLAGMLGKSILQNGLLNLGAVSFGQLLEQMQTSRAAMLYATLALLLQAMETCAVPIFAFLLVEGVEHTSSLRNYALHVAGLAVLSELPYNLATSGKLLDTTSRNPVFGLVVCLVMVYLYQKFPEKNAPHLLLRVLVTAAAVIWCSNAVHPVWKQHGGPFRRAVGVPGQRLLPEPCGLGSVHPVLHLLAVLHGCADGLSGHSLLQR